MPKKQALPSQAPWHIGDFGEAPYHCSHVISQDGNKVCTVESYPFSTTGKADAKLIMMAPEILTALKLVVYSWSMLQENERPQYLKLHMDQAEKLLEKLKWKT